MLVFLLIMGVVVFILSKGSKMPSKACDGPHKWEYGSDGYLYCKECLRKPNYEGRE
jgi:hypothetical protein